MWVKNIARYFRNRFPRNCGAVPATGAWRSGSLIRSPRRRQAPVRRCAPENASRANLIGSHKPAVTGNIGGQDGGKPAFDPALRWSGHGAALWAVFYTERRQGWMARRADARSWRSSLHGYRGPTLWTVIAVTGGRVLAPSCLSVMSASR